MLIAFDDKSLRKICEDHDTAKNQYGQPVAEALMKRLADIEVGNCPLELPAGKPQEIKTNLLPNFKVDLAEGYRLVFCANHTNVYHINNGNVDWSKVTRIRILKIDKP